jgi:hypothetical protein
MEEHKMLYKRIVSLATAWIIILAFATAVIAQYTGTVRVANGIFWTGVPASVPIIGRGAASQTGDLLELQNSATNNIFQFTSLASMVNGIQFNPANTGGTPTISVIGSDANIPIWLIQKGTGSILLGQWATTQAFEVGIVAGITDWIKVTPSATGNPATVSLACTGSDTNCNLNLVSKGTGTVQANGVSVSAAPTITLKKGTGLGNYTTTSATYVDMDSTNLALTVIVPVGQKVLISVTATKIVTASNDGQMAITDGATLLAETQSATVVGSQTEPLIYAFTGDGASHTFKIRFKSNTGTITYANDTVTHTPVMTFWMGVAN